MFSFFQTKPKKSTASKEVMLYRNCRELPIHNFNECMNGDMTYLIAGKRTPNSIKLLSSIDTEAVWLGIMNEYIELSKNSRAKRLLQNKNRLIWLQRRLHVLELIEQGIEAGYDVSEYLKQYNLKPERLKAQIAIAKNDISRLTPEANNDKENNGDQKNDFDSTIAYILEHGYQINRFTTVVSEYCEILNRIEQKNRLAKADQLKK